MPRKKSERFSLTIKDDPYPFGSCLSLSKPDQELYAKGLKYYICYYKWLTNPKNGDISGMLIAFHPFLAFFVININEIIFNDTTKFFVKFDFKDWLKITLKPYTNFAYIKGKDFIGEILNYWEAYTNLIGLRNIIRIPYLDRLAEEFEYTYYTNNKLDDLDLPEYIKPFCNNYYLYW